MGRACLKRGRYGAGTIFLPQVTEEREKCKQIVESIVTDQGQTVIGWRVVPTCADEAGIGRTARLSEPSYRTIIYWCKSLLLIALRLNESFI